MGPIQRTKKAKLEVSVEPQGGIEQEKEKQGTKGMRFLSGVLKVVSWGLISVRLSLKRKHGFNERVRKSKRGGRRKPNTSHRGPKETVKEN